MSRWIFFAALLSLWPAYAQAQGRTCQYDLECGVAASCNDDGRCVARGSGGDGESLDADGCGTDRRCRIDRLKRRNRAQRHADVLKEERQVRYQLEQEKRAELELKPRLDAPISGGLRVSRIGPIGLHAGYTFFGRLQPAVEVTYAPNHYVSENAANGSLEMWWIRAGLAYFLLDSWFTPYLSAGFQVGMGRFDDWNGFRFGEFSTGTQARFHAGEFGGGFDIQLKFGLMTRLGVVYRPLIYNQARIGPGLYDPTTRQGLADWYKGTAGVDVVWLLGWAI